MLSRVRPLLLPVSLAAPSLCLSSHHRQPSRQFATRINNNITSPQYGLPNASKKNIGLVVVPQQSAFVIERFGRFSKVLDPGLHLLIPLIDKIAYVHNLKEEAIPVSNQTAITSDNVTIDIDGVLYIRIVDPVKASYGISNIYYAMIQLAQTTMRSELGKYTLQKIFAEREQLNNDIVIQINSASEPWGVRCLRYEIRDISPPAGVKDAMDLQAEAERKKRATILDSEGAKESEINVALGEKQSVILQAEAEAESILVRAKATAAGIEILAKSIQSPGGKDAVSLRIAEQYVDAFRNLAKQNNTMLIPSNPADPAAMIASAMSIFGTLSKNSPSSSSSDASAANNSTESAATRAEYEALLTKKGTK